MVKYHQSPDGFMRKCTAGVKPCLYGASSHYDFADDQSAKLYNDSALNPESRNGDLQYRAKRGEHITEEDYEKSVAADIKFDRECEKDPEYAESPEGLAFLVKNGNPDDLNMIVRNPKLMESLDVHELDIISRRVEQWPDDLLDVSPSRNGEIIPNDDKSKIAIAIINRIGEDPRMNGSYHNADDYMYDQEKKGFMPRITDSAARAGIDMEFDSAMDISRRILERLGASGNPEILKAVSGYKTMYARNLKRAEPVTRTRQLEAKVRAQKKAKSGRGTNDSRKRTSPIPPAPTTEAPAPAPPRRTPVSSVPPAPPSVTEHRRKMKECTETVNRLGSAVQSKRAMIQQSMAQGNAMLMDLRANEELMAGRVREAYYRMQSARMDRGLLESRLFNDQKGMAKARTFARNAVRDPRGVLDSLRKLRAARRKETEAIDAWKSESDLMRNVQRGNAPLIKKIESRNARLSGLEREYSEGVERMRKYWKIANDDQQGRRHVPLDEEAMQSQLDTFKSWFNGMNDRVHSAFMEA